MHQSLALGLLAAFSAIHSNALQLGDRELVLQPSDQCSLAIWDRSHSRQSLFQPRRCVVDSGVIAGDFIDANRIVFSTQTCLHLATRQLDQSWQTRSAALSCGPIGEGLQPRIARLPQGAYMVLSDQNVRVVPLDLKDPNLGLPRSLTSSDWINLAAAPTALAVDQAQIFRYQQAVYLLSHVNGVWGMGPDASK